MARLNLTDIPYDDNYNLTDYEKNKGFPPHAIFRDTTDLISHAYVPFTEVSDDNNLLMQMFAQNGENVEKLVLVDAGQFPPDDPEWAVHPDSIGTRFIHAGKIVRGESGIPKGLRTDFKAGFKITTGKDKQNTSVKKSISKLLTTDDTVFSTN